ncbi:hypothetical protein [Sulfuriroseicoccus oceanibius]|uniref:Lipoprotein n=1 Tax=Sulfuriroseicoccus oceanibius TaxID=2707525 RepID=A0A6B3L5K4_9BACT|nr:hypothetical protein [Sulfuriroseicoccus oceanibius]QQL44981.1 hypothetical protein G3M56_014140 [Sulfuriroseicoccus oceanibius]
MKIKPLVATSALAFALSSCSTVKTLSPAEFEKQYHIAESSYSSSMSDYCVIGQRHNHVFLHRQTMRILPLLWGREVYRNQIYMSRTGLLSDDLKAEINAKYPEGEW